MKDGTPQHVSRVSGEIALLRSEIGGLVGELDRRRRELFDLRLQAKRHPVGLAIVAGAAALLVGGLVALAVRSRREARRPSRRARELSRAISRLVDHPDRVAAEESARKRILVAASVAAGTAIARRLVDRLIASPASTASPAKPRRTRTRAAAAGAARPMA